MLVDQLFSIDSFVETLDNMQLIDNDDLKELRKKIDIISRSISNKLDLLGEYKKEEDYLLLVA